MPAGLTATTAGAGDHDRLPRGRTFFELRGLASNIDGRILDVSEGAMTIIYSDTGIVVETARERFIGLAATSSSSRDGALPAVRSTSSGGRRASCSPSKSPATDPFAPGKPSRHHRRNYFTFRACRGAAGDRASN